MVTQERLARKAAEKAAKAAAAQQRKAAAQETRKCGISWTCTHLIRDTLCCMCHKNMHAASGTGQPCLTFDSVRLALANFLSELQKGF